MKLECLGADRKQPYLLFAREVNEGNQLTKIWVDVNLPKDGKFSCLTEMQRSPLAMSLPFCSKPFLPKRGKK
jgi:hypothetical protein